MSSSLPPIDESGTAVPDASDTAKQEDSSFGPKSRDPFADPNLRGPGLWRMLQESFGGRRRMLDVAQIEVSSFCPGSCSYCPHTTMREQWKARHMTAETFVSLWPLLLETRRVHLQGWGDPLLHPRFFDMAALARRADCLVSTTSCGLRMDDDLAAKIVGSGIDVMAFSLTGASRASNDAARKGIEFARVLDSVRLLQRVRKARMGVHLEIHFAYLMLASAVEEVLLLPELMHDLGVHAAVVSTLDYIPSPEWEKEAFMPHETAKIAGARKLLEQAASRARALGLSLYYSLPVPEAGTTCLENPQRSVYVDAEGSLSPCIYVNLPVVDAEPLRRVFGSSRKDDPIAVWKNKNFEEFRKALASGEPDAPCVGCPKRFALGNRDGS